MKTQLKKGALELCVLAVLARGDSYAYDIVNQLSRSMEISEGTVYPLMRRLQDEAWVNTYLVESSTGPSRKYYRLTPAGETALAAMQTEWREFVSEIDSVLAAPSPTETRLPKES
ncbi:PadR family transcriptional regulator [Andreprevotia chitinilytica]|uniref:PadR family transcriptional regulator n=1 Tax=Andreprevotia chitinilytica TaxID=396808 RepID=UPI00055259BB|nr:PadR family transcriptional regulator [Andreprevotia chitinilytica]